IPHTSGEGPSASCLGGKRMLQESCRLVCSLLLESLSGLRVRAPGRKTMTSANGTVRVAAMADIHCTRTSQGALQPLFTAIAENADVMLLCGDLTDYGLPEEAHMLAKELAGVKIPVLAVLGNHDYESGKQVEIQHILTDARVHVLDGDTCE